ncbi:MAG: hypothetical protein HWN68_13230 [Desulfobacterales bacterium]|nr:hypothetical protein [Desulfobacterales bacterium]
MDRLTDLDCPLDGAMQIGFQKEMSVSALCFAKIDHFSRVKKEIEFAFVHSLEIVAFNPLDARAFIEWLSGLWKGEWKEVVTKVKRVA